MNSIQPHGENSTVKFAHGEVYHFPTNETGGWSTYYNIDGRTLSDHNIEGEVDYIKGQFSLHFEGEHGMSLTPINGKVRVEVKNSDWTYLTSLWVNIDSPISGNSRSSIVSPHIKNIIDQTVCGIEGDVIIEITSICGEWGIG